ncbi:hypothetical protein L1987_54072 [Smallanthus sonchifolius]|uniref:Uncharacterized protein n=1 Tax=Smallanthus sonchifolius TaxID=185202 RepID=A0ACB9E693_9ASTR|nr:hypothetical protein L1987_54072 [Smallanthus sonchifolius]
MLYDRLSLRHAINSQVSGEDDDLSVNCIGIVVDHGNIIFEAVRLKWKDTVIDVWVEEETRDWVPDCLGETDSSESNSDSSEEVEDDQAMEVESPVVDMGNTNGLEVVSTPNVEIECQQPKEKEKRPIKKPAILRPKKTKGVVLTTSPSEDNIPKKRSTAEMEDPFDLNRLLGLGLFGVSGVYGSVEGDNKDPGPGRTRVFSLNSLDLNYPAIPVDPVVHCPIPYGDNVVVADYVSEQEANEFEAMVKMRDIVGVDLGNHSALVKEIIDGEGINVVDQ